MPCNTSAERWRRSSCFGETSLQLMAGIEFGLRGLMCFEQTKCSIVCSSVCAHECSCAERVLIQ